MFCENCGAPVLDDAKFCPACGEPVNATSAAASEPQPVQIQPAPAPQPVPQGAPTPPPMPGAVELDRNFGMILLLTIVTCGIYGIYAYYKISEDVATMCSGDGDDMPNYLIAILLSFITCGIYGLWWTYHFGNRIQANGPRYGLTIAESGTTLLLWQLIGASLCGIGPIIGFYLIVKNVNAMAAAYTAQVAARA